MAEFSIFAPDKPYVDHCRRHLSIKFEVGSVLHQPLYLLTVLSVCYISQPTAEAPSTAYDEHVLKIFRGKAQFLVSGLDGSSAAVLGASAVGWEI